ncbi:MAG: enoyl-CoA hydratase/isomerase family protein [Planctomycetota bacterium]|jgi:methylglutaconyl-CoA hydratase
MEELVQREIDDGIATLTLNRPEKRNALSPELIDALLGAVEAVAKDTTVRVMILAGAGRSFCAGMDLRGVLQDAAAMGGMLDGLSRAMRAIRRLSVPTISRVQGAAVGGGCGLMVVTDFSVTHPEAKVGYPEVSLAVCPAVVAPWLIQRVGAGRARAMLLAGGTTTGVEGHQIGLATHLVEQDRLETATRELADELAGGGQRALSVTKRWLNELDGSLEDDVFDRAARLSAEVIASPEAQERLSRLFAGSA